MNILAIGSHPDDIELGCGGTLIRCAREGHNIYTYTVTRGEVGGDPNRRIKELIRSSSAIPAKKLWIDSLPDTKLTINSELIYHIEWVINKCSPDVIFTHSIRDTHHDHRAAAQCTIEAGRMVPSIFAYEIPVTKEFNPQVYIDISDVIYDKLEVVNLFSSQRDKDYTEKKVIKGLAEYRALQSRLNSSVSFVEAFELVKTAFTADFKVLTSVTKTNLPKNVKYDMSNIIEVSFGPRGKVISPLQLVPISNAKPLS